jgi:hypothetical protein
VPTNCREQLGSCRYQHLGNKDPAFAIYTYAALTASIARSNRQELVNWVELN